MGYRPPLPKKNLTHCPGWVDHYIHCRIGSSETGRAATRRVRARSLPHRQLRNIARATPAQLGSSQMHAKVKFGAEKCVVTPETPSVRVIEEVITVRIWCAYLVRLASKWGVHCGGRSVERGGKGLPNGRADQLLCPEGV